MRRTMPRRYFRLARLAATAAALLLAAFLVAACGRNGDAPRELVALDEAFAAMRPELASRLEGGAAKGRPLALFVRPPVVARLALSDSPAKALEAAQAERKRGGKSVALVTSPLVAKSIVEAGSWSGDPKLFVPGWEGGETPGLWAFKTDPVPAYRALGAAAGAYIAALAKAGGSPSCGVLFSESVSRPREALSAFAETFAEASEGRHPNVRELGSGLAGRGQAAVQVVSPGDAEAAAEELLGMDIRLLFVALGSSSEAAIRRAVRPGLVIGADSPFPEASPDLDFRIVPDEKAMALRIEGWLGSTAGNARGTTVFVPSRLIAGPRRAQTGSFKVNFRRFLSDATLSAKASSQTTSE
jgi:hypothetical protein